MCISTFCTNRVTDTLVGRINHPICAERKGEVKKVPRNIPHRSLGFLVFSLGVRNEIPVLSFKKNNSAILSPLVISHNLVTTLLVNPE